MMLRHFLWLVVVLLSVAAPAVAGDRVRIFVTLPAGQPITIRPDRAYILFRTRRGAGEPSARPVLMRVVPAGTTEQSRAPNVQNVDGKPSATGEGGDFYLVEVPPGDYVLYGITNNNYMTVCNCLGTVGFSAPAGRIVDVGTYLADQASGKSKVPELAAESGFGASIYGSNLFLVATLVPVRPDSPIMPGVDPTGIVTADFRVIGTYPNNGSFYINRLAPIPGVLAYGPDGQVIDVKRGVEVPAFE